RAPHPRLAPAPEVARAPREPDHQHVEADADASPQMDLEQRPARPDGLRSFDEAAKHHDVSPQARACSSASAATSLLASPCAMALSSRSRKVLPLGSGTRAMSPAPRIRFASLRFNAIVDPARSYASSTMILP